jgi:sigma-B regulation protein RsbU (phosphoserine phosphatase)
MDKDDPFRMFEDSHGVVCGAMEGIEYEDYNLTIPSGGGIFLYTDGIPEAINTKDEAFGLERIEENLNAHPGASSRERIEFMQKAIEDFSSGIEQFDDITMMCLIR